MYYGKPVFYIPSHDPDAPVTKAKAQWLQDKANAEQAGQTFSIAEPSDPPINALVSHEHFGLASHLGDGGEALAHLVFVDASKENLNLGDPRGKLLMDLDVVHASHEFTEEEAKRNGALYAGGRWHESRDPRDVLREIAAAKKAKAEAQATAAQDASDKAAAEARAAKEKADAAQAASIDKLKQ